MQVSNLMSNKGNKIANQFNIIDDDGNQYFQSYDSIIAKIVKYRTVYLDEKYWNYSKTTSKYRNIWLGLTTRETEQQISDGKIILTNLNN